MLFQSDNQGVYIKPNSSVYYCVRVLVMKINIFRYTPPEWSGQKTTVHRKLRGIMNQKKVYLVIGLISYFYLTLFFLRLLYIVEYNN